MTHLVKFKNHPQLFSGDSASMFPMLHFWCQQKGPDAITQGQQVIICDLQKT
jgi:hypothetical protein